MIKPKITFKYRGFRWMGEITLKISRMSCNQLLVEEKVDFYPKISCGTPDFWGKEKVFRYYFLGSNNLWLFIDMQEQIRHIVRAEIRALFEAFSFDNNKTYDVPDNVAKAAKKALEEIEKNKLTDGAAKRGSGVQKAKELSEKKTQTHAQLQNLKSFFETNEAEYKQAKIKGQTMKNSALMQSWELHGGNVSWEWTKHKLKMTKQSNLNTKKNLRIAGGAGTNRGLGIFDTKLMSTNNYRIHR